MAVKRLNESELLDEVGKDEGVTVPSFIERMSMIVRSEEDAIAEYDVLLSTMDLPEELRDTIKEIQNDEKDHLVLLTNAISRYTNKDFSDNTEELEELPYPDETKEIVDTTDDEDEDELDVDIDIPDDDIEEF